MAMLLDKMNINASSTTTSRNMMENISNRISSTRMSNNDAQIQKANLIRRGFRKNLIIAASCWIVLLSPMAIADDAYCLMRDSNLGHNSYPDQYKPCVNYLENHLADFTSKFQEIQNRTKEVLLGKQAKVEPEQQSTSLYYWISNMKTLDNQMSLSLDTASKGLKSFADSIKRAGESQAGETQSNMFTTVPGIGIGEWSINSDLAKESLGTSNLASFLSPAIESKTEYKDFKTQSEEFRNKTVTLDGLEERYEELRNEFNNQDGAARSYIDYVYGDEWGLGTYHDAHEAYSGTQSDRGTNLYTYFLGYEHGLPQSLLQLTYESLYKSGEGQSEVGKNSIPKGKELNEGFAKWDPEGLIQKGVKVLDPTKVNVPNEGLSLLQLLKNTCTYVGYAPQEIAAVKTIEEGLKKIMGGYLLKGNIQDKREDFPKKLEEDYLDPMLKRIIDYSDNIISKSGDEVVLLISEDAKNNALGIANSITKILGDSTIIDGNPTITVTEILDQLDTGNEDFSSQEAISTLELSEFSPPRRRSGRYDAISLIAGMMYAELNIEKLKGILPGLEDLSKKARKNLEKYSTAAYESYEVMLRLVKGKNLNMPNKKLSENDIKEVKLQYDKFQNAKENAKIASENLKSATTQFELVNNPLRLRIQSQVDYITEAQAILEEIKGNLDNILQTPIRGIITGKSLQPLLPGVITKFQDNVEKAVDSGKKLKDGATEAQSRIIERIESVKTLVRETNVKEEYTPSVKKSVGSPVGSEDDDGMIGRGKVEIQDLYDQYIIGDLNDSVEELEEIAESEKTENKILGDGNAELAAIKVCKEKVENVESSLKMIRTQRDDWKSKIRDLKNYMQKQQEVYDTYNEREKKDTYDEIIKYDQEYARNPETAKKDPQFSSEDFKNRKSRFLSELSNAIHTVSDNYDWIAQILQDATDDYSMTTYDDHDDDHVGKKLDDINPTSVGTINAHIDVIVNAKPDSFLDTARNHLKALNDLSGRIKQQKAKEKASNNRGKYSLNEIEIDQEMDKLEHSINERAIWLADRLMGWGDSLEEQKLPNIWQVISASVESRTSGVVDNGTIVGNGDRVQNKYSEATTLLIEELNEVFAKMTGIGLDGTDQKNLIDIDVDKINAEQKALTKGSKDFPISYSVKKAKGEGDYSIVDLPIKINSLVDTLILTKGATIIIKSKEGKEDVVVDPTKGLKKKMKDEVTTGIYNVHGLVKVKKKIFLDQFEKLMTSQRQARDFVLENVFKNCHKGYKPDKQYKLSDNAYTFIDPATGKPSTDWTPNGKYGGTYGEEYIYWLDIKEALNKFHLGQAYWPKKIEGVVSDGEIQPYGYGKYNGKYTIGGENVYDGTHRIERMKGELTHLYERLRDCTQILKYQVATYSNFWNPKNDIRSQKKVGVHYSKARPHFPLSRDAQGSDYDGSTETWNGVSLASTSKVFGKYSYQSDTDTEPIQTNISQQDDLGVKWSQVMADVQQALRTLNREIVISRADTSNGFGYTLQGGRQRLDCYPIMTKYARDIEAFEKGFNSRKRLVSDQVSYDLKYRGFHSLSLASGLASGSFLQKLYTHPSGFLKDRSFLPKSFLRRKSYPNEDQASKDKQSFLQVDDDQSHGEDSDLSDLYDINGKKMNYSDDNTIENNDQSSYFSKAAKLFWMALEVEKMAPVTMAPSGQQGAQYKKKNYVRMSALDSYQQGLVQWGWAYQGTPWNREKKKTPVVTMPEARLDFDYSDFQSTIVNAKLWTIGFCYIRGQATEGYIHYLTLARQLFGLTHLRRRLATELPEIGYRYKQGKITGREQYEMVKKVVQEVVSEKQLALLGPSEKKAPASSKEKPASSDFPTRPSQISALDSHGKGEHFCNKQEALYEMCHNYVSRNLMQDFVFTGEVDPSLLGDPKNDYDRAPGGDPSKNELIPENYYKLQHQRWAHVVNHLYNLYCNNDLARANGIANEKHSRGLRGTENISSLSKSTESQYYGRGWGFTNSLKRHRYDDASLYCLKLRERLDYDSEYKLWLKWQADNYKTWTDIVNHVRDQQIQSIHITKDKYFPAENKSKKISSLEISNIILDKKDSKVLLDNKESKVSFVEETLEAETSEKTVRNDDDLSSIDSASTIEDMKEDIDILTRALERDTPQELTVFSLADLPDWNNIVTGHYRCELGYLPLNYVRKDVIASIDPAIYQEPGMMFKDADQMMGKRIIVPNQQSQKPVKGTTSTFIEEGDSFIQKGDSIIQKGDSIIQKQKTTTRLEQEEILNFLLPNESVMNELLAIDSRYYIPWNSVWVSKLWHEKNFRSEAQKQANPGIANSGLFVLASDHQVDRLIKPDGIDYADTNEISTTYDFDKWKRKNENLIQTQFLNQHSNPPNRGRYNNRDLVARRAFLLMRLDLSQKLTYCFDDLKQKADHAWEAKSIKQSQDEDSGAQDYSANSLIETEGSSHSNDSNNRITSLLETKNKEKMAPIEKEEKMTVMTSLLEIEKKERKKIAVHEGDHDSDTDFKIDKKIDIYARDLGHIYSIAYDMMNSEKSSVSNPVPETANSLQTTRTLEKTVQQYLYPKKDKEKNETLVRTSNGGTTSLDKAGVRTKAFIKDGQITHKYTLMSEEEAVRYSTPWTCRLRPASVLKETKNGPNGKVNADYPDLAPDIYSRHKAEKLPDITGGETSFLETKSSSSSNLKKLNLKETFLEMEDSEPENLMSKPRSKAVSIGNTPTSSQDEELIYLPPVLYNQDYYFNTGTSSSSLNTDYAMTGKQEAKDNQDFRDQVSIFYFSESCERVSRLLGEPVPMLFGGTGTDKPTWAVQSEVKGKLIKSLAKQYVPSKDIYNWIVGKHQTPITAVKYFRKHAHKNSYLQIQTKTTTEEEEEQEEKVESWRPYSYAQWKQWTIMKARFIMLASRDGGPNGGNDISETFYQFGYEKHDTDIWKQKPKSQFGFTDNQNGVVNADQERNDGKIPFYNKGSVCKNLLGFRGFERGSPFDFYRDMKTQTMLGSSRDVPFFNREANRQKKAEQSTSSSQGRETWYQPAYQYKTRTVSGGVFSSDHESPVGANYNFTAPAHFGKNIDAAHGGKDKDGKYPEEEFRIQLYQEDGFYGALKKHVRELNLFVLQSESTKERATMDLAVHNYFQSFVLPQPYSVIANGRVEALIPDEQQPSNDNPSVGWVTQPETQPKSTGLGPENQFQYVDMGYVVQTPQDVPMSSLIQKMRQEDVPPTSSLMEMPPTSSPQNVPVSSSSMQIRNCQDALMPPTSSRYLQQISEEISDHVLRFLNRVSHHVNGVSHRISRHVNVVSHRIKESFLHLGSSLILSSSSPGLRGGLATETGKPSAGNENTSNFSSSFLTKTRKIRRKEAEQDNGHHAKSKRLAKNVLKNFYTLADENEESNVNDSPQNQSGDANTQYRPGEYARDYYPHYKANEGTNGKPGHVIMQDSNGVLLSKGKLSTSVYSRMATYRGGFAQEILSKSLFEEGKKLREIEFTSTQDGSVDPNSLSTLPDFTFTPVDYVCTEALKELNGENSISSRHGMSMIEQFFQETFPTDWVIKDEVDIEEGKGWITGTGYQKFKDDVKDSQWHRFYNVQLEKDIDVANPPDWTDLAPPDSALATATQDKMSAQDEIDRIVSTGKPLEKEKGCEEKLGCS